RMPPNSGLSERSPRRGRLAGVRYHSPLNYCSSARLAQFIYTMNRVSKVVPRKRVTKREISISFIPAAKIGGLGLNGSGRSTLLRIMAGVDKEFEGEARPQPGIKIGLLSQEPQLNPSKDVRGNVIEGVAEVQSLIDRFNA